MVSIISNIFIIILCYSTANTAAFFADTGMLCFCNFGSAYFIDILVVKTRILLEQLDLGWGDTQRSGPLAYWREGSEFAGGPADNRLA